MGDQSVRIGLAKLARLSAPIALALLLANCAAGTNRARNTNYSPKVVADGEPVPRGGGAFKLGKPYTINGRTYMPSHDPAYRAEGIASYYGADFHGRQTANGEVYDMNAISAAHPTMPMPSYARVTNLENGRSIVVRVNDRGPYAKGRIIDLSIGTAKALGAFGQGLARVRVEYVGRAGLAGSDDNALLASLRHGTPAPAPGMTRLASSRPSSPVSSRDPDVMPMPRERPFALGDASVRAPARAAAPAERAPTLGLMSGRSLY
ncbi:MAG: septal ring lytic transglycosylase RlpA family protein [Rhizobiales bacterium]|nr:septal ring lytic transglycosylase RlpA family protein [Hyphomicrobiales bacterium]